MSGASELASGGANGPELYPSIFIVILPIMRCVEAPSIMELLVESSALKFGREGRKIVLSQIAMKSQFEKRRKPRQRQLGWRRCLRYNHEGKGKGWGYGDVIKLPIDGALLYFFPLLLVRASTFIKGCVGTSVRPFIHSTLT